MTIRPLSSFYKQSRYGRSTQVELSLDTNDGYRIVFLSGVEEPGSQSVPGRLLGQGLRTEAVRVPAQIAKRGFDSIRILPLYGDGSYSVGHLRLMP